MKSIFYRFATGSFVFLICLLTGYRCSTSVAPLREQIDLSGEWQFALDTAMTGEEQRWFTQELPDRVLLPGTTDENQKGFQPKDTTTMHLTRRWRYEGAAWYRKTVDIPAHWSGKTIKMLLERTRSTKVWVDDQLAGTSQLLQSAQQYELTALLTPGRHVLTICVNNDLKRTPYGNVHIYSNDTQTNWNGILGKMVIEATAPLAITSLQVRPLVQENAAQLQLSFDNPAQTDTLEVDVVISRKGEHKTVLKQHFHVSGEGNATVKCIFPEPAALWDAYEQPLYEATVVLTGGDWKDAQTATFGMREFGVKEKQFTINGRKSFLRGKHEAAVFPLTGYPPMDVAGWERVFRIAKEYGINHYRFHTYCPPEAAFAAADQVGIYLQAELPFWGGLDADSTAAALLAEGHAMLQAYGNHPSFVMFSPGNEIWGGHERVEQVMTTLKAADNRPLYTMGSNNNIGYMSPRDYADFFVGARVPNRGDTTIGQVRLTHAFADAWHGGYLNTVSPNTLVNFQFATDQLAVPLVSHEIGQYQIYPDYDEIAKYTGVLRADNLGVFQRRLAAAGMADLDSAFQQASGAWSALCYKAEMEAALRTPQMAGFQLLDLQDFPGQGTALVGILDAFMDSKEVISVDKWRQSCSDVVLLAAFEKYCWTSDETFSAVVQVANYSNRTITGPLRWELVTADGAAVQSGQLSAESWPNEGLSEVSTIAVPLQGVSEATQLRLKLQLGTAYSNEYDLWVYPGAIEIEIPAQITVANDLDEQTLQRLQAGGEVLLFPNGEGLADHTLSGLFPPDFWNYGMFKMISGWNKKEVSPGTLGLLMDPQHPLLDGFPTDFHTNFQWYSIIKACHPLIMRDTDPADRPLVQVIDNLERNEKLALILEYRVGKGKLLICMADLRNLTAHPEARQLYRSLVHYMGQADFQPATPLPDTMMNWLMPE